MKSYGNNKTQKAIFGASQPPKPPNLPTAPHITGFLTFKAAGNHGFRTTEGTSQNFQNLQISEHQKKKDQMFLSKSCSFQNQSEYSIFLTKRQNSMVVSACELNLGCSQANLRKPRRTLHPPNGRNRPR